MGNASYRLESLDTLSIFLPEGAKIPVLSYLNHYKVHLFVTRRRSTILGNFRCSEKDKILRISVNGDLNRYEFLITLLHELAHLIVFVNYGRQVAPHGVKWKEQYVSLLEEFLGYIDFPQDIRSAIMETCRNPAATAGGEEHLIRILRRYDPPLEKGWTYIGDLPLGSFFKTENGNIFQKMAIKRKRYTCRKLPEGQLYSFSSFSEVFPIPELNDQLNKGSF